MRTGSMCLPTLNAEHAEFAESSFLRTVLWALSGPCVYRNFEARPGRGSFGCGCRIALTSKCLLRRSRAACGHAEPRPSGAEARRQRQFALVGGVPAWGPSARE